MRKQEHGLFYSQDVITQDIHPDLRLIMSTSTQYYLLVDWLVLQEDIQKDDEILAEPDLPEPQEPVREQEKDIRDRIVAKAMEIRRRPGNVYNI